MVFSDKPLQPGNQEGVAGQRIANIPGTQGYAEHAAALIPRYELISFVEHHAAELHLLPTAPSRILDIGAGTGVDAAWFAAQGHTVVAVEPTAEFLAAAMRLHPSPLIEWLDDALPKLDTVMGRGQRFDVVMLSAVWMHLDEAERCIAMPRVTSLLAPGGVMVLSLRHGPVPAGRRMFAVSGEETIALARQHGLGVVLNTHTESLQSGNRAAGVTWTRLAFRQAD
jgi:2-polyprenyl-3-methyl-5-hydroxy-6-metoxy-1,4-benzoquinol methylase